MKKQLLLHGPATASSRQKLSEIRKNFISGEVLVFEEGVETGEILTNLQSQSLFGDERLVIVENPPEDFVSCQLSAVSCQLILWFDHEIDIKKWPGFEHLFFPETKEVSVFPFLDYLGQKDKKAFLELDKLKKAGYESQYFITMILYLLRNLAATPKTAKDFVRNKNERMRKNFGLEKITDLYQDILEIDFKIKSGLLEKPQAEFLLVNLFLH